MPGGGLASPGRQTGDYLRLDSPDVRADGCDGADRVEPDVRVLRREEVDHRVQAAGQRRVRRLGEAEQDGRRDAQRRQTDVPVGVARERLDQIIGAELAPLWAKERQCPHCRLADGRVRMSSHLLDYHLGRLAVDLLRPVARILLLLYRRRAGPATAA